MVNSLKDRKPLNRRFLLFFGVLRLIRIRKQPTLANMDQHGLSKEMGKEISQMRPAGR